MSVQEQEATGLYRERAAETLSATLAEWERATGEPAAAASGVEYVATGSIVFSTAFIWGIVLAQLQFDGGPAVQFDGKHWGAGFGGGVSWGVAYFSVPASQLKGGGDYSVVSVPGALTATFFKDGRPVGVFTGGGLSVGPLAAGGWGEWTIK
jgi:hypothetical protein